MSNKFFFTAVGAFANLIGKVIGFPTPIVPSPLAVTGFILGPQNAGEGSDQVPPIVTDGGKTSYRDLRDPTGTWRQIPDGTPVSPQRQKELTDQWDERMRELERLLPKDLPPLDLTPVPPRNVEEICRNPNFPRNPPPTYRIVYVDPLAIDLDGDGIETVGINGSSTVLFDHDADGLKTGTGWLKGDDAWLVRDLNGNGTIDSGAEMFGDQTLLPNGQKAASGLQALRVLDSNADGKIDANDAAFAELKIWQDLNQNGITDAGELKTLTEAGLTQINVNPNQPSNGTVTTVAGGHYSANQVVNVTRADGTITTAADLSTNHDGFYSQYTDRIEIPEALRSLPNLKGMGRLRDLREAAALSPALADLLTQYAGSTSRAEQKALIDDLLTEWAKTDPKYNRAVLEELKSWGIQDANSPNIIYVRRSAAGNIASFMQLPRHRPRPVDAACLLAQTCRRAIRRRSECGVRGAGCRSVRRSKAAPGDCAGFAQAAQGADF